MTGPNSSADPWEGRRWRHPLPAGRAVSRGTRACPRARDAGGGEEGGGEAELSTPTDLLTPAVPALHKDACRELDHKITQGTASIYATHCFKVR